MATNINNKLPFPTGKDAHGPQAPFGKARPKPDPNQKPPTDGKQPPPAPKPEVQQPPPEQQQTETPKDGEKKAHGTAGEEGPDGEFAARTTGLDVDVKTPESESRAQQKSGFDHAAGFEKFSHLPDQFGKKLPLTLSQDLPSGPHQNQQQQGARADQKMPPGFHDAILPQQHPDLPPEVYRQLVNDKLFSGPMRNTPLYQKLMQQALPQQASAAAMAANSRLAEPLTKGEILQMFRMRHQADEKERFKEVIKNEVAKLREAQSKKVQSVKYQADSQKQKEVEARQEIRAHTLDAKRTQIAARLQMGQISSRFEAVLQKLLGGEKPVPQLPQGVAARFAAKTGEAWNSFFKNVLGQGSVVAEAQGELKSLIEALYRGVYTDTATGETRLVADLAFSKEGEVLENKYSQLKLADPKLADELNKLIPGDTLSQATLEKLGDKLDLMILVHVITQLAVSEEDKQKFLKSLRQQHSSGAQRTLEDALQKKRDDDKKSATDTLPFPVQVRPERFTGSPKIYMWLFYGICTFGVGLILWIILRAVL